MGAPEHRLHIAQRERAHGDGTEAVTKVVEADAGETGGLDGVVVVAPKRPTVDVLANGDAEDEVVVAGEVLAAAEPVERANQLGDEWDAADFARLRCLLVSRRLRPGTTHVDALAGEVDIPPAQRQQLALT